MHFSRRVEMKYRQWMLAILVSLSVRLSPLSAASLAEMTPEGALLYVAWPGADAYAGAIKDTEFSKLLAEPEIVHFREMFREKVWRFLRDKMKEDVAREGGPSSESFEPIMTLLESAWHYPTVFSFIGVAPG